MDGVNNNGTSNAALPPVETDFDNSSALGPVPGEIVMWEGVGMILGQWAGPFGLIAGKALGIDFGQETDATRAAGFKHLTADGDLEQLDALFDQRLEMFMQKAQSIKDPKKREAALQRLRQIKAAFKMATKTLDSAKEKPEMFEYAFFELMGSAGGTLENGSMGDVFAMILSGDVESLDQLMGKDGFLGFGDGLDGDQWTEIQNAFLEDLQGLRQNFELKPKERGDEIFDDLQNRRLAFVNGETEEESTVAEEKARRKRGERA